MPHKGRRIHRSGLAKKKGGIGRHVTKTVNRTVFPNLQEKRIWVPELGQFVKMKNFRQGPAYDQQERCLQHS